MMSAPDSGGVAPGDAASPSRTNQVPVAEIQLRLMADQMPAVLWTTDLDLRYTFIRGAGLVKLGLWADDVLGLTVEEVYDQIGRTGRPHPELQPHLAALAGESVRVQEPVRDRIFDAYLEALRDPDGKIIGTIGIALDVTERVAAMKGLRAQEERDRHELEVRVAERTSELSILLKISSDIASTLELRPLLCLILDELKVVDDSTGAAIGIVEGQDLVILESRGTSAAVCEEEAIGQRLPLARLGAVWQALSQGQAVVIDDVRGVTQMAAAYRASFGTGLGDVRSWLSVPLMRHGQAVGLMSQSHNRPNYYTPRHAELAAAIAHQAAIAIENARLYEQAQEESRKTAALARVASSVALGGPLVSALDEVARNVVAASEAVACSLTVALGTSAARLQLLGTYGLPDGYGAAFNAIMNAGQLTPSTENYNAPGPYRVRHVRQTVLSEPIYAPLQPFMALVTWDTMISLPSVYQGRKVARLNLYYRPEDEPGEAEMAFLSAIADQAAIAIENARLYAEAEAKAALEERQRLARELHDSVSQALYSIVLGAETAREYLRVDPARAARPLEYVRSLADAGLAEMKALIFELRSESLEKEGLVAALTKQAAALHARYAVEVVTELADEPALPLDAKEALYRIAQEALHNVVKHAEATQVEVRLASKDAQVVLEVRDNGRGFDPAGDFPGHLGLRSMCERACRAGGALEVQSSPGAGATLRATLPVPTA